MYLHLIVLIIFFLFLIINHFLHNIVFPKAETMIEAMTCNPNEASKRSACFKKKIDENKSIVSQAEKTVNDLLTQIKTSVNNVKKNSETIDKTKINIQKIKNSKEGRGVDNSSACEKHPEACK